MIGFANASQTRRAAKQRVQSSQKSWDKMILQSNAALSIEGRRSCRTGSRDERFLLKFVSTLKAIILITTREGIIKLIQ